MSKFKIGDKVEIINDLGLTTVNIGDIGVIERIDEGSYKVRMDKDSDFWWATDNDLKLIRDNPYDNVSKELKQFYDSLIKFGFPEKRAWALIRIIIRENARK